MNDGDFLARLVDVASREIGRKRVDDDRHAVMELIADAFGRADTAVLVWLKDEAPSGGELRLAYCCDAAYCCDDAEAKRRPTALRCLAVPDGDDGVAPTVAGWFAAHHGVDDFQRKVFPLLHRDNGESYDLGIVEILTIGRGGLSESLRTQRINVAVAALAAKIHIGRSVRPMDAVRELQTLVSGVTITSRIIEIAAKVLRSYTGARLAVIYRPVTDDTDRQLKAVAIDCDNSVKDVPSLKELAPTSTSLTFAAFGMEGIFRLDDIHMPERNVAFAGVRPDQGLLRRLDKALAPAQAWLCAPVQVGIQDSGRTNIASMVLFNKRPWRYLYGAFTDTDERIASAIGEYLAAILPGTETLEAMQAISERAAEALEQPDRGAIARAVFEALQPWVPGMEAAAFVFEDLGERSIHAPDLVWEDILEPFPVQAGMHTVVTSPPRCVLASQLAGKQNGWLLIGLRRRQIPSYQVTIIERAAVEMATLAYEAVAYERALNQLVEIRHAIRSGIQGIVGHVGTALAEYRLVARDGDPLVIRQEMLDSDDYRSSLEAGLMAAQQIKVLLEGARYAFSGMRYGSLQLGSHDLFALIGNVVRAVRPEAEQRGLVIRIFNRLPDNERAFVFDKNAVWTLVYNIIENAIKYAFRSTEIAILLWNKDGYWKLAVRDHGAYISPHHHKAIFMAFRRAVMRDPTARGGVSSRPGTGLGLFVCKKIVEAHSCHARIEVESIRESDGGRAQTIFTVTMPVNPKGESECLGSE